MRRLVLVSIVACSSPAKPARPIVATPPPPDAAPVVIDQQAELDRCAADAKAIQPMLDRNLALHRAWGDAIELSPRDAHLVRANDGLEKLPARAAVLSVASHHAAWIGPQPDHHDPVIFAIDADATWVDVVGAAHDLGFYSRTVYVAFAVDLAGVRVDGNPLADATADQMRALGTDTYQRCPAVADLFMHGDTVEDSLAYIARGAQHALGDCACRVTPRELAQLYDAMYVRDYVAVRSITIDRKGFALTAKRTATFAQVAPKIMAAAPGTAFAFVAE
ncbi:MAG TPA: hypothetical protein VL463_20390 [Kofleriaceae bacterium]|jgi:hypothetical protein|nr:hypothetical protein [Kofleriaceae bacterium]